MFEQAVLCPAPVRGWAVTLGFAGEVLVVACVLAVPLLWPQLLPRAATTTWISAPAPPAAPLKPAPLSPMRPTRPWDAHRAVLYQPGEVRPLRITLDEPPPPGPAVTGGNAISDSDRGLNLAIDSIMPMATPKPAPEPPRGVTPNPTPVRPQLIRVGGAVQAARLVHRVDPLYPAMARQMRIAGTVELAGVIGTDGRIRELRVTSGHPFLVQAALEAVRQWVYRPTLLGGEPVEVITTITVVFRLS
jgi:periplasmic protein TonB